MSKNIVTILHYSFINFDETTHDNSDIITKKLENSEWKILIDKLIKAHKKKF